MEVRAAIVTGAASGIGALAVTRMRSRGIPVVAADRNPVIHQRHRDDEAATGQPLQRDAVGHRGVPGVVGMQGVTGKEASRGSLPVRSPSTFALLA